MEEAANIDARDSLALFSDAVQAWFLETFPGGATDVQVRAWRAVAGGQNALVIAPTGSGKTLAAFLFAIDALMREKVSSQVKAGAGVQPGTKTRRAASGGVRVLYVSPLKALGADVERNLQEPLAGIAQRLEATGACALQVRTGMRTGDTPPDVRRALVRTPPDILITTPESLYLMLTSKARETLQQVETVIVDEVHALAGNKRGAHLAVSLERLDALLERPAQRIGLSATVRPRDEIARFLGGAHPVSVVAAEGRPNLDVQVSVPVPDMTAVPAFGGVVPDVPGGAARRGSGGGRAPRRTPGEQAWKSDRTLRAAMEGQTLAAMPDSRQGSSSIWPYIEAALLDEVLAHRTTIIFVNSRGLCEKLTARLNELYAKRQGALPDAEAGGVAVGMRSDMGSTSDLVQPVAEVIAKAHHGSVSKERRQQVERELKAGELPCVVATSSLELGIDMGSIDLVLQVAPPPSIASGLQRIGRANHRVGGCPAGVIYPRTRTEVIDATVVAEGMAAGHIEETTVVKNPLDVLAQQTVAAAAVGDIEVDEWFATVRRAAPFTELSRRAFDAVLDMLAGRYASADLADFSPRVVWDRERGVLSARPGAQRQAVTAAGTIPDRGMFSVVLPEGDAKAGRRRVGELDEEMVYESRVGDIIALGTSTWRIREITRDRVLVEPAPGRSARLPFWHGEGIGRPAQTGRMRGEFVRAVAGALAAAQEGEEAAQQGLEARLAADGLDEHARRNLIDLVQAQRSATGSVPDDRTLVVERCEDEQGDWRVMLHSPYGRRVHEPWAMAVTERVMRTQGFDPQTLATDDGILLRIPLTETQLPGAELFAFDPDELERVVRQRVGDTSLFAARFRECAARALFMSPTMPGKRAPLWQQRMRAGQLLEAARRAGDFPLLAETARECLQDVYDLPALRELLERIQAGSVRFVEAHTSIPSPFAAPLLFGYVGDHLYDGDLPRAERAASLLSLDPTLLGELLCSTDMAQLLDASVVQQVEAELQRVEPSRRARGVEGVADLLRVLGPLSLDEVAARMRGSADGEDAAGGDAASSDDVRASTSADAQAALEQLHAAHRAFPTTIGGVVCWASADDTRQLHDALGSAVPAWASALFAAGEQPSTRHPLDELVARYARTHGPFSTSTLAARFGVGGAVARESLARLVEEGRLVRGRFDEGEGDQARTWLDEGVFRRLRALSLAKARKAVHPVSSSAYVRFLLDRQGVGEAAGSRLCGIEGVAQVIAQFEGVFLPAALWEAAVLPTRVRDYRPAMLDDLIASGEVVWVAARRNHEEALAKDAVAGSLVAFYPTDSPFAPVAHSEADALGTQAVVDGHSETREGAAGAAHLDASPAKVKAAVARALSAGGLFFRQIVDAVRPLLAPARADDAAVAEALCDLALAGQATNDTFAPIRALAVFDAAARPHPVARRRVSSRRARVSPVARTAAATTGAPGQGAMRVVLSGRWSLVAPAPESDTARALALVESLLDRYGVLTRDVAVLAGVPGGLDALRDVLRSLEDAGEVLRGMFVEGLGPAQFAARETIDALRTFAVEGEGAPELVVLAADDPASLFGAGIPWPLTADVSDADDESRAQRPARRSGSVVVVRGGQAVLYASAGLRSVLAFTDDPTALAEAAHALVASTVRTLKREGAEGARKKVVVETFNGRAVLDTPFAELLQAEGLVRLPDGMRLYVSPF